MQVEAWLTRAARLMPTRIAVQTADARLTYAELLQAASRAANELSSRGAGRGERVAIALPAGIDFAVLLHACLLLGAVAVPIDLRLTDGERERIVAETNLLVDAPLGLPIAGQASPTAEEREDALDPRSVRHDLSAVCAVIHTSGTTSAPRPIELTYHNFLWSALGSAAALGVDTEERWLCALPLCHVGGLSILMRSAIYATTAVLHGGFDVERVLLALREQKITLVSLVATTLARLLDGGLSDPPRLRWALTGGGPVPDRLLARARAAGVPVVATYGLTEACSQVTTGGPPLFCTRVSLDDSGEILVCGPTVAPACVADDGWLHTGDLGWLDGDGFLHVRGRASDTIVSGGENVAPGEVEAVLESHPEVIEAAVVGRADEAWGEAVTAIVRLAPRSKVTEIDLRAHCIASLAPFKVPKRVCLLTTPLPRTRSGKLLRREL